MTEIAGKTVLITGGAQGIGLGIARAFAREGAKLAIVDVGHAALETCKKEFSANTTIEAFEMDEMTRALSDCLASLSEFVRACRRNPGCA